jgi:hypothetical protein
VTELVASLSASAARLGEEARGLTVAQVAPPLAAAVAFVLLFATPASSLAGQFWSDPEAGHGLLLLPTGWRPASTS